HEVDMQENAPPRPAGQTARLREEAHCLACGWPVIVAFCNDGMARTAPYSGWDNWIYCSNKTCRHHGGEGIFHHIPDWIKTAPGYWAPASERETVTGETQNNVWPLPKFYFTVTGLFGSAPVSFQGVSGLDSET